MSSDATHPRPAFSMEQIQMVAERMREEHCHRYRRRALKNASTVALAVLNLILVLVHPEAVYAAYTAAPPLLPGTAAQFYWLVVAMLAVAVPLVGHDALEAWRQRIPPEGEYVEPALAVLTEYAEQHLESHEQLPSGGDRDCCLSAPADAFQEGEHDD